MSRKAEKLSFGLCGETCPALDNKVYSAYQEICKSLDLGEDGREIVFNILMEKYIEEFKEVGTHLLRGALNEACETIIELEDKISELEYEISNS